ncbi:hypothetical protein [Paraburkholderia hayleyella]|uniref:hypothetical protein n=1 Tax=Paraburkholderia hayleyella TaxID=2152889 RepID=UPI001FEA33D0|nr:hypothetical protein [Paraburkholderia hayleyella]
MPIEFQSGYADRDDHIALKGSWTQGGRERTVLVTTAAPLRVLDLTHPLAGAGPHHGT